MANSYKKSFFTKIGERIDSIKGTVFPKKSTSETYPYESDIEERWGASGVIFGPIEREIYAVMYALNQQNPQSIWQLNTIELTIPAVQRDRVNAFLSKEFQYTGPTNFDRAKLIHLMKKNIFSLNFYHHIDIMVNEKIQLIIHGQDQGQSHLFKDRKICVNKTKVDISSCDANSNISANDIDNSNKPLDKKSVQIRIYDENGKRIVNIEKFPATLGTEGDFKVCGRYVSRKHIRLNFDKNHQLVVENISKTNPIFVNNIKLNKHENDVLSKSTVEINDYIYIAKITHDEQESKNFPRLEIVDIKNGVPTSAYRKTRGTPSYYEDNNATYAKPNPTPYAEPPPTPIATPNYTQPLFQIVITIGGKESKLPITRLELPCLIGRLDKLPENSPYKKIISTPSYYQGVPSTVSRKHLVIDDFQNGVAIIKSLGQNGCFINGIKQAQDLSFSLSPYCELQLGVDNPPVKIMLIEP